jgi:glycosyltransferase involved in cell wall biosynthesis
MNIVISGINIFSGGPISVFYDFLNSIISQNIHKNNKITIFVHKSELFDAYNDKLHIIELPKSRESYLLRFWYEYVYFNQYSKENSIDIWISLHDITPNVVAKKRYVYCHNPSIFMKPEVKNIKYSLKNYLFSLFYKYIYKVNITKNDAVIVQQEWIRDKFISIYNLKNVIVARPNFENEFRIYTNENSLGIKSKHQFFYPAYPRFFKNFEIICQACEILEKRGIHSFNVSLTIDGSENRYAKDIVKRYGNLKSINFVGILSRDDVYANYNISDCLIFPSKLETWGLPISEFKSTGKPIIAADLPYAYETLGKYDKVLFFDPNNSIDLSNQMLKIIEEKTDFTNLEELIPCEPYANNWDSLIRLIFEL